LLDRVRKAVKILIRTTFNAPAAINAI